ncbi:MAG TPA: GIY-YIG nuclease family protein [Candidatus Babeliales bacterium]|jgi:excinuclease ABC subunit C|nr:GIY-YIG nuclease family protein [Candidatus Babeliales bacterium]
MTQTIKKFEESIPKLTGVYLFKDAQDAIIYIGKAKNLHHRVNSYFQKYNTDWKIRHLIDEYTDVDYILTPTETESLLLEAELVQKYKPKFNVLLKEGQPFLYILFTQHPIPTIELVRNKKKKGTYFGPFLQKGPARKTFHFLMQTFHLNICNKKIERGCLDYHIGNCAGTCKPDFDLTDYCFRITLAREALKNNQDNFIQSIKDQMSMYNATFAFEKSQRLHEYLHNVDTIFATLNTHFSTDKFATDIFVASTPRPYTPQAHATINVELQHFFRFSTPVRTIDCFDISHFQSSYLVGSCVRFTDGQPEKSMFRHFKIKTLTEQNDYAALQEIIQRRYKSKDDIPDLIVIDGGKGQLSAAYHVLPDAPIVSLAKREETIYGPQFPDGTVLDIQTNVGKLLIALRDYAHHFAISYHRLKRKKGLTLTK